MNGKDFAGITKSMAPPGTPPHWLPYMAVEDVDSSADKVKQLGGKVLHGPVDIPNVGRFATVADPQGAVFSIYRHSRAEPPEPDVPPPGSFCWEELMTPDPEAAAKFYTGLFGYAVESIDMGPMGTYRLLKRRDRQTAGVMKPPPGSPAHPYWLTYVAVQSVDAATKKAEDLGARVLAEPMDIPDIGRFSVIADPTGAAIGLFSGQ